MLLGSGKVRRSNSSSMRVISRPKSRLAPGGSCRIADSRSSRASSTSMPGEQASDAFRYRPGCLKADSKRESASATALGHISWSSTRRIAARVRAETPRTLRTGYCHRGRHRSARTASAARATVAQGREHPGACFGTMVVLRTKGAGVVPKSRVNLYAAIRRDSLRPVESCSPAQRGTSGASTDQRSRIRHHHQRPGLTRREHVDHATVFDAGRGGGVGLAPTNREVVHAQDTWSAEPRIGQCHDLRNNDSQAARLRKGSRGGRPPGFDQERYKKRNTVERAINRLKHTRAVATRYDKRGYAFLRDRDRRSPRHPAPHMIGRTSPERRWSQGSGLRGGSTGCRSSRRPHGGTPRCRGACPSRTPEPP